MNRDLRRRQDRQARLQKNKDRIAKSAGAGSARSVSPAPEFPTTLAGRVGSRWRVIAGAAAALAVAAVLVWFFAFRGSVDTSDLNIVTPEDQGREHLNAGEVNPAFNTNPPTSGGHDPSAVSWGVYTAGLEPFPTKENLVHNMEHGGVVIWYNPGKLSQGDTDTLIRKGVFWVKEKRTKVVVVPWTTLDDDTTIAVTAWGKLMKLQDLDIDKITRFVDAYEGPGPENVPFTSPVIIPAGY